MKTKKQPTNRILSLALALVMVISMLPLSSLTASAIDAPPIAEVVYLDGYGQGFFGDITSAVEFAEKNPGSTLRLLDNITTDYDGYIQSGSFTIDLNGKTWENSATLFIGGEANIKIIDSSTEGKGKLLRTSSGNSTIQLYGNAKLEIAGGTVENNNQQAAVSLSYNGHSTNAQLTVSGGKVTSNSSYTIIARGDSVTVKGGEIESDRYDINYRTGTLDLSSHSDPAEITIYVSETLSVGSTLLLPPGYVLLDDNGNVMETLNGGQDCTVDEAQDTYTVMLDPNGGTIADGKNVTKYAYGVGATLPTEYEITREAHTFAGWYEDKDFSGSAVTKISEIDVGNKTYYAKWVTNKYPVTFNAGMGTFADGKREITIDVEYGTIPVAPETPTLVGYLFTGWTPEFAPNGVDGATYTAVYIAGDSTYTVITKTMNTNGEYDSVTETKTAKTDSIVSVTPENREGFAVDDYSILEATVQADNSTVLEIIYNRNQYNLTIVIDNVEKTEPYYYGEMIRKPDDPVKEGYVFAGWDSEIPETMPTRDLTVTAVFCNHIGNTNKPADNGDTHSFTCSACGTVVTENHTKVYSVNEDTNTITAVCDICHGVCGSATLYVPDFAYYTNSPIFSAGYSTSLKNGEEVKVTYNGYSETTPPISVGTHTARLTVYENKEEKASVTAEYEITYLPAPSNPYTVSGHSYYDETNNTFWFNGGATVTVKAPSGYTISKVLDGNYGASVEFSGGDNKVIYLKDENGAMTDAINVEGVRFDGNAPTGKITVEDRGFWEKLISKITFGLFFKGDAIATVSAMDNESGWKSIQYYLAYEDLIDDATLDNTQAVAKLEKAIGGNWKTYSNEIALNNNAKNVIYVKITDNVGNVTYISSDGIVLDSVAPTIEGIENGGVYYGDTTFKANDTYLDSVTVYPEDVTLTDGAYTIVADNGEHTIVATDKAGNVTEYKITVYKNYTVTYKVDGETYRTETVGHGKDATLPDVPEKEGYSGKWDPDGKNITADTTITAIYTANSYKVSFDTNGGEAVAPITVTFEEKYGRLPSSSVAGFSGGDKNWYLVDANGTVTETNIKNLSLVSTARDHKLFIKRNVLAPNVSIKLTVPGGISDGYQYYIPGASQRVLTATVNNANTELLNYTYQWYKDGAPIEGATASVLTLEGNVADSGTYKVEVTATLKDGTGIVATTSSATGSKEQNVKILHAANTLSYDANGGEGGPQSSYTGGTSLNVSKDEPTREHYDFIGWNTKADGSGDSYKANDVYIFTEDGGNGGCKVTLYAQWKAKEYTVTYKADGAVVDTVTVEHGKDAASPNVPKKDGYVGKWDRSNENITSDTVINAVYTKIDNIVPDELKTDDKTDLEDAKKQLEDMLDDNSYTEDDKKAIQDAIDDIDDALKVIGNVEAVLDLINKLPDTIKKDDEAAIKAADDAYNALTDYEKSLVDGDAKKALDDAKATLAELNKPVADSDSPQTGDNSHIWLWIAIAFISGSLVIALGITDKQRKAQSK